MRFYRLKHKETGMICAGTSWSRKDRKSPVPWKIRWESPDKSEFLTIFRMNYLIEDIYKRKLESELDNMILENAERVHTIIPGTVRLKTIRNRLEQKAIINKLKYG